MPAATTPTSSLRPLCSKSRALAHIRSLLRGDSRQGTGSERTPCDGVSPTQKPRRNPETHGGLGARGAPRGLSMASQPASPSPWGCSQPNAVLQQSQGLLAFGCLAPLGAGVLRDPSHEGPVRRSPSSPQTSFSGPNPCSAARFSCQPLGGITHHECPQLWSQRYSPGSKYSPAQRQRAGGQPSKPPPMPPAPALPRLLPSPSPATGPHPPGLTDLCGPARAGWVHLFPLFQKRKEKKRKK